MKWGWFIGKSRAKENPLEDPKNLAKLLVALSGKWDTPALIAYLAGERGRLLVCKALVSPVSGSDRQLAQRVLYILRFRGIDPERLKKRLEPAALVLGLVSSCDVQIDYYDVLGVRPSATLPELRAAYRKNAFELHPDTAQGTKGESTDFVTLQAAYDTLMDPNSREAFDQCRVQLGSWHEEDPVRSPDEGARARPTGKLRKACYRITAVVAVMVVIAWVLSILYETESMLEVAQVTSPTEPGPVREMAGPADTGEMENKRSVLSEVVEDKAAPKKPGPKKVVREKPASKKPTQEPLKTAVVAVSEPVEVREQIKAQAQLNGEPHQAKLMPGPIEEEKPSLDVKTEDKGASEKPKAALASEPVEVKALPSAEQGKKQAAVVRKSLNKQPNSAAPVRLKSPEKPAELPIEQASIPSAPGSAPEITSPSNDKLQTKKPELNVSETVQAKAPTVSEHPAPPNSSIQTAMDSPLQIFRDIPVPNSAAPVRLKSPEKPAESPVQQASIPSVSGSAPGITSPSTDKLQTKKPEPNVSETTQAQAPAVSEHPAPPNSSIQTAMDSPLQIFRDIPVPKTHKTPLIKRSQVLAFLKRYTVAYERGNAETFFSYFTANATENGKPLKAVQPDYIEVWDKVEAMDYSIFVEEVEQVVGSDSVFMKGRFDLAWEFIDGPSGQSRGEIFMDLKLNKRVLRISRLDYRFDGE